MIFNAVLGHRLQNSLVSVEAANAYFATRSEAEAWTGISGSAEAMLAAKQTILVTATMVFLNRFEVWGAKLFQIVTDSSVLKIYREDLSENRIWLFNQALELPKYRYLTKEFHRYASSSVGAGSSGTAIIDPSLANGSYWDDEWNEGSLIMVSGSLKGAHVRISDFARSTGTLTIESLGGTPTAGDSYYAIMRLPRPIEEAFLETVLNVARGRFDMRANRIAEGVTSLSDSGVSEAYGLPSAPSKAGDYVPKIARDIMRAYVSASANLQL